MTSRSRGAAAGPAGRLASRSPVDLRKYFVERVEEGVALRKGRTKSPIWTEKATGERTENGLLRRENSEKSEGKRPANHKSGKLQTRTSPVLHKVGLLVLSKIVTFRLYTGLFQLQRNTNCELKRQMKGGEGTLSNVQQEDTKSALVQTQKFALVKCPKCEFVGVSVLTSSTKERISPKFVEKISCLLPSGNETTQTRLQLPSDRTQPVSPAPIETPSQPFFASPNESSITLLDSHSSASLRLSDSFSLNFSLHGCPTVDKPSLEQTCPTVTPPCDVHNPVKKPWFSPVSHRAATPPSAHSSSPISLGCTKLSSVVTVRTQFAFDVLFLSRLSTDLFPPSKQSIDLSIEGDLDPESFCSRPEEFSFLSKV